MNGSFDSTYFLSVFIQLPSIEVVANSPPTDRDQRRPPILVLVICPTRELASQAAAEATKLLKYHPTIGVQVVIGGTRLALEQKRMQANPCQVNPSLIAAKVLLFVDSNLATSIRLIITQMRRF